MPFGNYKINQPPITVPPRLWTFLSHWQVHPALLSLLSWTPLLTSQRYVCCHTHHSSFHSGPEWKAGRGFYFHSRGVFRDLMTCRTSQYKPWKCSRRWSHPVPIPVVSALDSGRWGRVSHWLCSFVIYLCLFSQNLGQDKYQVYGMVVSMIEKRQ